MAEIHIRRAETPADVDSVRCLLREYASYLRDSPGTDNMDFTKYEEELRALPGPYTLFVALVTSDAYDKAPAGCVALRALPTSAELDVPEGACELKRLWVSAPFRGLGLGRKLTEYSMADAARRGFKMIYLDTVPGVMVAANRIYEQMEFQPVNRYNDNPVANVKFFRRSL